MIISGSMFSPSEFRNLLDRAFQPLQMCELKIFHNSDSNFRKTFLQVFNQGGFYFIGKNGYNRSISGYLKMADVIIFEAVNRRFYPDFRARYFMKRAQVAVHDQNSPASEVLHQFIEIPALSVAFNTLRASTQKLLAKVFPQPSFPVIRVPVVNEPVLGNGFRQNV